MTTRKRKPKESAHKMLHGGNEPKRIELLLSLTKMNSDEMHKALLLYFCDGFDIEMIASMTSVTKSNLHRDIAKLNKVNETIEKVKEHDYHRIRKLNKRSQLKSVK